MTSTSSGVGPSLPSHYITRHQLVTDYWAESDSPSGLISHKLCSILFPSKETPQSFQKTTICREISKHVTLIEVQSMVLCQSHTKSGAVECKSNKLLNTELLGQNSIKRAVCFSLCQTMHLTIQQISKYIFVSWSTFYKNMSKFSFLTSLCHKNIQS